VTCWTESQRTSAWRCLLSRYWRSEPVHVYKVAYSKLAMGIMHMMNTKKKSAELGCTARFRFRSKIRAIECENRLSYASKGNSKHLKQNERKMKRKWAKQAKQKENFYGRKIVLQKLFGSETKMYCAIKRYFLISKKNVKRIVERVRIVPWVFRLIGLKCKISIGRAW
jgi:hypothetical protein